MAREEYRVRQRQASQKFNRTLFGRYQGLRYKARRPVHRGCAVEMSLTFEQYADLLSGNCCTYCHGPLPEAGAGLDRLDSSKGYIPGNCTACCRLCNTKKGRFEGMGFKYPRTVQLLLEVLALTNANC